MMRPNSEEEGEDFDEEFIGGLLEKLEKKGATKEVAFQILEYQPELIEKFPPKFKNDREIAMFCVERDGLCLRFLNVNLIKDKELVLRAVKNNCWAVSFAHASLLKDKEVARAAITGDVDTLSLLEGDLKNIRSFFQ